MLKKQLKVAFCNESCLKVARKKTKFFYGLMLKYENFTTKVRFLNIFVQLYFAA